jgi:hypothetical protein
VHGRLAVAHFPGNDLLMKESAAGPVIVDDEHPDVDEPVIAIRNRLNRRRFLKPQGEPERKSRPAKNWGSGGDIRPY